MTKISDPVQIGNVRLKNRIMIAPMVKGMSDDDGWVNEPLIESYEVMGSRNAMVSLYFPVSMPTSSNR